MNIKVDFDNIVVKEDKNDFNVKVLMLKGEKGDAGESGQWGSIGGNIANQTDLQNALNSKANQSAFNTLSNQVSTNTSNISTINGQITDINGELDDFEDLFYGNATVNHEDTSITLDNTVEAGFESFDLKGNTTQDGTPTPTSPIPVNVVSGDNEIEVQNANLWCSEWEQGIVDGTTGQNATNTTCIRTKDYIPVIPNQHYAIKRSITTAYVNVRGYNKNKVFLGTGGTVIDLIASPSSSSAGNPMQATGDRCIIAPKDNVYYLRWNDFSNDLTTQYMMIKGDTIPTNYVPYEIDTYNIDLPEGMELCKIGNYQDYFYKDSDKWYLYKKIGKVVLNGSETGWFKSSTTSLDRFANSLSNLGINLGASGGLCSHFAVTSTLENTYPDLYLSLSNTNMYIDYGANSSMSANDFKSWLSTHNVSVYYFLATPTNTEITYQPLIDQLNLLEKATSKENQTNISQVNNDLPFIIYAEAFANTFNGRMEGMDYKIDNCEVLNNKVTSITSGSTDSEYPSAKAVYDLFNSITDGDEVSY